jgi:hypothetical protein
VDGDTGLPFSLIAVGLTVLRQPADQIHAAPLVYREWNGRRPTSMMRFISRIIASGTPGGKLAG